MTRIARIERVRGLLSFDHSLLRSLRREFTEMPPGQISLPLDNSEAARANQSPNLRLIGFDEAGRGSLAGPVAVACVHFDWNDVCSPEGDFCDAVLQAYADLNDSKQVTQRVRERLYERILADARWGIGCASAIEIDRLGIVKACCIAALRAYRHLGSSPGYDLGNGPDLRVGADIGLFDRGLSLGKEETKVAFSSSIQITKGDATSFHIAAASILAKVRRDAIMRELDARASAYGFAKHKGYGTVAHFESIRRHGPSRFHRRTFLTRL